MKAASRARALAAAVAVVVVVVAAAAAAAAAAGLEGACRGPGWRGDGEGTVRPAARGGAGPGVQATRGRRWRCGRRRGGSTSRAGSRRCGRHPRLG